MLTLSIAEDAAAQVVLTELYLASLRPRDSSVVIQGPKAIELFNDVVGLANNLHPFAGRLNTECSCAIRLDRAFLFATTKRKATRMYRGRSITSVFLTAGANLPEVAWPSTALAREEGLGRIYSVMEHVPVANPHRVSIHRKVPK